MIPGQGTKIPHASKSKRKNPINKFNKDSEQNLKKIKNVYVKPVDFNWVPLTKSEDTLDCHDWRWGCYCHLEAGGQRCTRQPTMHRKGLHNKECSDPKFKSCPGCKPPVLGQFLLHGCGGSVAKSNSL